MERSSDITLTVGPGSASNPTTFVLATNPNHPLIKPLIAAQKYLSTIGLEVFSFDRVISGFGPLKHLPDIERHIFDFTVGFQASRDGLKAVPNVVKWITTSPDPEIVSSTCPANQNRTHRRSMRHKLFRLKDLKDGELLRQINATKTELVRVKAFLETRNHAEKARRITMCLGRMEMAEHELTCKMPQIVDNITKEVVALYPVVLQGGRVLIDGNKATDTASTGSS
ncbi:hypothetical protein DFH27DRAFT_574540 [Peziza echinospora]|nr:hypothetical protein DFH27DRAFT_574540 [Peziza echinospora]